MPDDERQRAVVALAHGSNDAMLAGLVGGKATVDPMGLVVRLLDRAPDVATVDLDVTADMKTGAGWQAEVKGMLKAEMKRRNMTYDQLSAALAEIGVKADSHVLRNKVARGGFSAVFFVQCLGAMNVTSLVIKPHE